MIKRILFGLLWFFVLYLGACFITGAIAGGLAGSKDPANASAAGARAGAEAVAALRVFLLVGAALLAGAGTWAGLLPGARPKKATDDGPRGASGGWSPQPLSVQVPEPALEFIPEVLPVDWSPRLPHPGFWWTVLWCLGLVLLLQLLPGFVGGFILGISSGNSPKPEKMKDTQALLNSPEFARAMMPAMLFAQILSVALAGLVIRLIVGKGWPRILALRWPSWSHLLLALLGLPGLIFISMGVDGLAKQVLPSFIDLDQMVGMFGKWPLPLGVLIIGLGPGIGEELWFRAFFGRGLVSRYGVVGGVLLTSLLFGLIHLEPRQAASALVIGVFLHLSYLASRSLLVPIILHAANNSLSILALHSPVLRFLNAPPEQLPWYVYGVGVLLTVAVGWAFFKSRTRLADEPVEGAAPWLPYFPGVEYPPLETATRVLHPGPGWTSWILAIVSMVLFAAVVIPVAVEVNATAQQERKNQRKGAAAPSAQEIAELLRKEPLSAETWPAWSRRLRNWLGDNSHNTVEAYDAARGFLHQEYANSEFRLPMRDDAMAWYIYGRGHIFHLANPREGPSRGRTAERLLRRSIQLDPTIGRAHYGLAVALLLQVDPNVPNDPRRAEARAEAAEAERLDPTESVKSPEAWVAMMQKRFADAERLYRELLQERPGELKWTRAVAQAIVWNRDRQGSYAAGIEPLLQRFPDDGLLRCQYAEALSLDGQPRSAARELDRARKQGVDPIKHIGAEWVEKIEAGRNKPE